MYHSGLDIPHVDLILNFDIPTNSKDYIHRVGRTARAGRGGRSISFVTQYDVELFQRIEALIGKQLELYPTEEESVLVFLERVGEAQRYAAMVCVRVCLAWLRARLRTLLIECGAHRTGAEGDQGAQGQAQEARRRGRRHGGSSRYQVQETRVGWQVWQAQGQAWQGGQVQVRDAARWIVKAYGNHCDIDKHIKQELVRVCHVIDDGDGEAMSSNRSSI